MKVDNSVKLSIRYLYLFSKSPICVVSDLVGDHTVKHREWQTLGHQHFLHSTEGVMKHILRVKLNYNVIIVKRNFR